MPKIEPGPGQDPPPAFSPRRRRWDSLLAAEDTNHLYRAFRIRRTLHPGSARRAGFEMLIPPSGAARERKMPMWLNILFSGPNPPQQASHDLWLMGYRGDEVVEAIYLEAREPQFRASVVALLLFGLIGTAIAIAIDQGVSLGSLFFLLCFWGLCVEWVFVFDGASAAGTVQSIQRTLDRWSYAMNPRTDWVGAGVQMIVIGFACLGVCAAFCVLGFAIEFVGDALDAAPRLQRFWNAMNWWYVAALVILATGGASEYARRYAWRRTRWLFEHQKRRAMSVYPGYFGAVVFKDSDAIAAVLQTYGELLPSRPAGKVPK